MERNDRLRAEKEIRELKEWQEANQPTGICETCAAKSVEDMYRYKLALDEIEKLAISTLGNSEWCGIRNRDEITQILLIINETKEK